MRYILISRMLFVLTDREKRKKVIEDIPLIEIDVSVVHFCFCGFLFPMVHVLHVKLKP